MKHTERLIFIALGLAITLFHLTHSWGDRAIGFLSDDAVFLMLAEFYSPWYENKSAHLHYLFQQSQFPPLFPLLLGLLGVNTDQPELAQSLATCCLVIAITVFAWWTWRQTQALLPALLFMLLFSFLPSTLVFSLELWSEFLFLCFIMCIFLFWDRTTRVEHWLLIATLVALAALTRTAGIALIAAFVVMVVRHRPRRRLLLCAVAVLPVAIWTLYQSSLIGDKDYLSILVQSFQGEGLGDILSFYAAHLPAVWMGWMWNFGGFLDTGVPEKIVQWLSAGIALFSGIGLQIRLRQWRFDAWFCLFSLGLIFIWPFTGEYFTSRFLYPLMPLLIFYSWEAVLHLARKPAMKAGNERSKPIAYLPLIALLIICLPASAALLEKYLEPVDESLQAHKHTRKWYTDQDKKQRLAAVEFRRDLAHALATTKDLIGEGECVYSTHTPMAMLHSKRISYLLPEAVLSDEDFSKRVQACRYIIAMNSEVSSFHALYPLDRRFVLENYVFTALGKTTADRPSPSAILAVRK